MGDTPHTSLTHTPLSHTLSLSPSLSISLSLSHSLRQCVDLATLDEYGEPQWVCLKVIKNSKDFFDQSLDEIKLLQYINSNGDADKVAAARAPGSNRSDLHVTCLPPPPPFPFPRITCCG